MLKVGVGLGKLTLLCRKCTRESVIPAPTMEVAVDLAKLRGWVTESDAFGETFVCPACPTAARLESGTRYDPETGRVYRTHCGSCGKPFDAIHNRSCPHCEGAAMVAA